jgi:hypothetical protein
MRTRLLTTVLFASVACLTACKHDDAPSAASTGDGGAAAATAAGGTTAAGSTLGAGFEGVIEMHMTSPRSTEDVTFTTKGGKMRFDPPARNGQTTHVIFDPKANKSIVLIDAQKMYMEMDTPTPPPGGVPTAPLGAAIVKSGKHETVAGTDCEDWTSDAGGKHAALCVASGINFFDFNSMRPGGGEGMSWVEGLKNQGYFPLRAVETDASGKEVSRMEVTKIEKKSVDDSLFVVPAGYHAMTMPHGMPGMPGGMPGMPPGMNR